MKSPEVAHLTRAATWVSRVGSRPRNRLAALGVVGILGLGGGMAATAAAPETAAAFNTSCGFSQIGNYGSPLFSTNRYGTQHLQPCDGVYVVCYHTFYRDSYEWVNWTSRWGYEVQGWIRDRDLQTYSAYPRNIWRDCYSR